MSGPHRYDALVLDASARQSLVAVRSLGRHGLRVAAAESHWGVPAFASRHCAASLLLPPVEANADDYVDALLERLGELRPETLFTAHDGTIEALRRRRHDVERYARVALGGEAALDIAVSKPKTLAAATAIGIPIPTGFELSDASRVGDALAETGLPAVLKPVVSWVGAGGAGVRLIPTIAMTRSEVEHAAREAQALGTKTLVQTWLSGRREAVNLLHADGGFPARFAHVAHRMNPPLGGMAVLRESIRLPRDTTAWAERLISTIGLDGYSEVEFRRDARGRPFLMEINPRLTAGMELAERSGIPFPQLMHRWVTGARVPPVNRYRVGVKVRWVGGDLRRLRHVAYARGQPDVPSLRAAVSDLVTGHGPGMHYDYVDRQDPAPAFTALRGFVGDVLARRGL